jgi:hypothetical protein
MPDDYRTSSVPLLDLSGYRINQELAWTHGSRLTGHARSSTHFSGYRVCQDLPCTMR